MRFLQIIVTERVAEKLALFDLTADEAARIVNEPMDVAVSRSSGLPLAFGYSDDGRYFAIPHKVIDRDTAQIVSGFPVPEPS